MTIVRLDAYGQYHRTFNLLGILADLYTTQVKASSSCWIVSATAHLKCALVQTHAGTDMKESDTMLVRELINILTGMDLDGKG